MAKLCDKVGCLTSDLEVVSQERDRLVEGASKLAEEHRLHVVEVEITCAAAEEKVLATFLPGFETCLAEIKLDHATECRDAKRADFWKG